MKKFIVALVVLALLIIPSMPMTQMGMDALSNITGLKITSGSYYFFGTSTIICAKGSDLEKGITWEVLCFWKNLYPMEILLHSPKSEI